ncbi:MAG: histidine acid phosphatase [Burkholderiaceae bacterium]|nr:histidine acid phosphatase [Burkholderiaceae bacterium]
MKKIQTLAALSAISLLLAGCGGSGSDSGSSSTTAGYYATKTAYKPQQDASSYEAAPAGFSPVYVELVARHGSRGLSSMKYDDAVLNMWKKAKADNALTTLGAQLGPDVEKIMKANFLLGYGVSGISSPGYGNLTQVGITEHQELAKRMMSRMSSLFAALKTGAKTSPRTIDVMNSGQDRAVDSSQFFANAIATQAPELAGTITTPPTIDRYQLYFHKLGSSDQVTDSSSINYTVYQNSQAYQAFDAATDAGGYGTEVTAKIDAVRALDANKVAARTVLERLFTKEFVDKIDNGTYSFANNGSYTYNSADGKFTSTLTGNGKTKIKSMVDAAQLIYELYIISPSMKNETGVDFNQYVPATQAKTFAYLQDIEDFYKKGPSATEYNGIAYNMALGLQRDFFDEVSRIASGDLTRAARLRFAHAETIIPFAAIMGVPGAATPVARAQTYSYDNNSWRGDTVSPMAANMQWDVYRNASGKVLVKMLYNEKETDFKPACDSARYASGSRFYDFQKLKACYLGN